MLLLHCYVPPFQKQRQRQNFNESVTYRAVCGKYGLRSSVYSSLLKVVPTHINIQFMLSADHEKTFTLIWNPPVIKRPSVNTKSNIHSTFSSVFGLHQLLREVWLYSCLVLDR